MMGLNACFAALAVSVLALLALYLRGMVSAYRAAGDSWKTMDPDVRMVFILAAPLFRGGINLLMWIDRLFYAPKSVPAASPTAQSIKRAGGAQTTEETLGT
jgi:hypothetical protein